MQDNASKNKILIVDDSSVNLISMTNMLVSDYAILTAKNGIDALKIAKKYSPDVILLDVIMPDMDGYQVLAELKRSEATKDIPVIFITGLNNSENEEKGLALGAVDFISKTLSETIIKLRIKFQIQNANQLRTIENLNKDLESALEEARAANKAKSSFLANMSHEIRTPMNTVLGITEMLMQDESITPEIFDKVSRIYSAGELLQGLLSDVLNLSVIESGTEADFTAETPHGWLSNRTPGCDSQENLQQFHEDSIKRREKNQFSYEPMPYGSVLVVDDNESNLYVASGLLKPYRLKTDMVLSGRDALSRIKDGKIYDVIFMDHMMPEMDGIETAKLIREQGYNGPIVALTANAVVGQAEMFLNNGFDDFISKPIDIHKLNTVLTELIRDKQPDSIIEEARKQFKPEKSSDVTGSNKNDSLLIESFIRDADKALSTLEQILINKEYETADGCNNYTIIVHGMKSSLYNTGNSTLAETALMLEKAGNNQDAVLIESSTPLFITDLRKFCEQLKAKREADTRNDTENVQDDANLLREKLLAIQDLCADYNRKGALDTISGIKGCSEQTRTFLNSLKEMVMSSDFEEAESAVIEFLESLDANAGAPVKGATPESILLCSKINGLDILSGLQKFGNDTKTYLKVLRSFADSTRNILNTIQEFNTENLDHYRISVHSIKGTGSDIFATETSNFAGNLEDAAKKGDTEFISTHHPLFLDDTRRLIGDIDDLINTINSENPKPKKDKPDSEALSRLMQACKEYSMDGAEEAMAQIDAFEYVSDGGLAVWLRKNVDLSNFADIVKRLQTE